MLQSSQVMNNAISIKDPLSNKIGFYHLACFLIMLPFDRFYSELILVSFTLHTIIHLTKEHVLNITNWKNLIPCSVFLLSLIGFLWTKDPPEARSDIEHQLVILILPILLVISGLPLYQYRQKLLLLFSILCTVTIIYLYVDAIRIILYNKLPLRTIFSPFFINHNFSEPINMHATYFSIYTSLSLTILIHSLSIEKNQYKRAAYFISILVLTVGLLQLSSKSVLLATMLMLPVGFFFFIPKGKIRNRYIITSILFSVLALLVILKVDSFKERFVTGLKDDLVEASFNNDRLEPRMVRWESAFQLIRQAPIFGYGTGSEKGLLKETYYKNKMYNSYLNKLNAHNEYISTWLKTGILGLIVLFSTFIFGFIMAFRKKDVLLFSFMTLITIVSFSENIFDVNKGIFFYAFFFPFLLLSGKPFSSLLRLETNNPS
jgi:O-antigen ligase